MTLTLATGLRQGEVLGPMIFAMAAASLLLASVSTRGWSWVSSAMPFRAPISAQK